MRPPKAASILRRLRPSLRVMMAFVLVLALALGWFAHLARAQRQAVLAIYRAGGSVLYDHQYDDHDVIIPSPSEISWFGLRLPPDYFGRVVLARMAGRGTDSLMAEVARLSLLESLDLADSPITDAGVAALSGLTRLRELDISNTKATAASFESLTRMKCLYRLNFTGIVVEDEDLAVLGRLTGLSDLELTDQPITDSGLSHLRGLKLNRIRLAGTRISDAGLDAITGCLHLHSIDLSRTQVGDAGLDKLAFACQLVAVMLNETKVTEVGVSRLARLPKLTVISLRGTSISPEAIAVLRKNNPRIEFR